MTHARILIVEDDPDTVHLLEYWLRANHYPCIGTVATGHEALALANAEHPDLVLMECDLPGELGGIETADILLERYDIPVLYLAATTDEALLERAPAACLTKPFNERELGRAVEAALDRHALLSRLKASEAHLAEAQAVAHIGNWRWNLQNNHVAASDEMLRLFDLIPDTFEPRFETFCSACMPMTSPRCCRRSKPCCRVASRRA